MVSCSGFGLPMHAQQLRLFVKCEKGHDSFCPQRSAGGYDAVVTVTKGDRKHLQGTVDERLINSPCGAGQSVV